MELGVDGVLLNTGIAHAADPLRHGPGDAGRRRRRPPGLSGRPHSQEALRHGQQPGRRHHQPEAAVIGSGKNQSKQRR